MKCAFCGNQTGKLATHRTTEYDDVCRECAIEFELILQFGEEYELIESGKASAELIARFQAERADWEAHFAEASRSAYTIPEELAPLDNSWLELTIEKAESPYRIELRGTAYDGIRYFWKLSQQDSANDFVSFDRLFESPGQALDDALEFLEALVNV